MSDMLLDPARTRLIIIGVDERKAPGSAERAFAGSARDVKSFFQNRVGLHNGDVLSRLNQGTAVKVVSEFSRYLHGEDPENVFVFLCAHGKSSGSALKFHLEANPSEDESFVLDFRELVVPVAQRMKDSRRFHRAVFIVDSCFSGLCHSIVESVSFPDTAQVLVITSNHREHVGEVNAYDREDGSASVFTREFLEVVDKGLSQEGVKDRPLLSLDDICEHLRKVIPAMQFLKELGAAARNKHLPSCSSWPDKDAVKTCGVFRNYRCDGSLQAQLLDAWRTLYGARSELKEARESLDQVQEDLNKKDEYYGWLQGQYSGLSVSLIGVREEGTARGRALDSVKETLDDLKATLEKFRDKTVPALETFRTFNTQLDEKLTTRHEAIQRFGDQLDEKLAQAHKAIEESKNEVGNMLTESDAKVYQGLKKALEDVGEGLKRDLNAVAKECARWRHWAWTLGIFGFAVTATLTYVLVSWVP